MHSIKNIKNDMIALSNKISSGIPLDKLADRITCVRAPYKVPCHIC